MNGDFRFLKVKQGVAYFAYVSIDAVPSSSNSVVDKANEVDFQEWRTAAINGAQNALAEHTLLTGAQASVSILLIQGLEVDTPDHVVEFVSFVATCKALGHDEARLDITFEIEPGSRTGRFKCKVR